MSELKKQLIDQIQASVQLLEASAKAVPADKQNWTPGGKSRSALSIVGECASFPDMIIRIVETGTFPEGVHLQDAGKSESMESLLQKLVSE